MPANDYHVIVYQLLSYLYECLKEGQFPNIEALDKFRADKNINERYWDYILIHLLEDGLVEGASLVPIPGRDWPGIKYTRCFAITPDGIGYLVENSLMQKMKKMAEQGLISTIPSFIAKFMGM